MSNGHRENRPRGFPKTPMEFVPRSNLGDSDLTLQYTVFNTENIKCEDISDSHPSRFLKLYIFTSLKVKVSP